MFHKQWNTDCPIEFDRQNQRFLETSELVIWSPVQKGDQKFVRTKKGGLISTKCLVFLPCLIFWKNNQFFCARFSYTFEKGFFSGTEGRICFEEKVMSIQCYRQKKHRNFIFHIFSLKKIHILFNFFNSELKTCKKARFLNF